MAHGVTFQVLDGIDKGRIFRDLPLPATIGREEGNILRLNDERVSRYHAKVQIDSDDFILTDLESTNGTRVNGNIVQIRRLRFGDRVSVGRSLLLFGSNEEIAARMASLAGTMTKPSMTSFAKQNPNDGLTIHTAADGDEVASSIDFEVDLEGKAHLTRDALFIGNRALPPMPLKLTPSQAARFAEILDFLHQGMTDATENIIAKEDGAQVTLEYADWQKVVAVQMLLTRYLRLIAEPPEVEE